MIPGKVQRTLWGIVLLSLSLLSYWPMFKNRFVWDDPIFVTRSETIRGLWPPSRFFQPQGKVAEGAIYPVTGQRPVMTFSFALDYALWKLNPFGYHLTNLLLHWLCVMGVALLGARASRSDSVGFLAGALFGLHPGHAEAVIAFLGRSDLLATAFVLAGFLMYQKHQAGGMRGFLWLFASLTVFGAACLSKETGLALLGILVLYEGLGLMDQERGDILKTKPLRSRFVRLIPFALVAVGYWFFRGRVLGGQATGTMWWGGSITKNFLMMLDVYTGYCRLLVFPQALSPLHSVPKPTGWLEVRALVGLSLLIATLGALSLSIKRKPAITFLGSWFVLGLVPVANIIPIPGVIFAERWLYLPSVGACVLGAWGGWTLYRRSKGWTRWAWAGLMAIGLSLFGWRTFLWNGAWQDEERIARTIIATNPNSYLGQINLGNALLDKGRNEEAIQAFQEAVRLRPNYTQAFVHLAKALQTQGRLGDAEQAYREVLRRDPNSPEAHNNLGNLLGFQGKQEESIVEYREAIRLRPDFLPAHYNLAISLEDQGKLPEAEIEYRTVLRLSPGLAQAYYQLGINLMNQGRKEESAQAMEAFLVHGGKQRDEAEALLRKLRNP